MELKKNEIFTISNFFSFLRIFFVFPFFYFIAQKQNDIVIYLAILAVITDWLDGFLARKLNQVTEIGKILDPLADKITIGGAVIALYYFQDFPFWLAILIILRDVFIIIGALIVYKKQKNITSSNLPGKVGVFFIAFSILAFLADFRQVFEYSVYIALAAIAVSGLVYMYEFLKKINHEKSS